MPRPLLLRALPASLRLRAWSRFYRGQHSRWPSLYRRASLAYAPGVRMDLVPGDAISDPIAFTGVYELEVTRRVVALAKQGGLMVDVGANLGYFSLLWAAANPSNLAIAVEASPRNLDFLIRNVNSNKSHVTILPYAAGHTKGKAFFELGPTDQTGWGGLVNEKHAGQVEVDVLRLDDVLSGKKPISLLKIDIEGADTWALMGCERLLRAKNINEIWFEQNKTRMKALGIAENEAQDYLHSVGYTARPLTDPSADLVEWMAVPS